MFKNYFEILFRMLVKSKVIGNWSKTKEKSIKMK